MDATHGSHGSTVPEQDDRDGHGGSGSSAGHESHSGGHGDHVAMFRRRFWWSLLLTVPVVATSHMVMEWLGYELDFAGIDIFRLDADGKIVEHWDVLQVIPDSSANDNGLF